MSRHPRDDALWTSEEPPRAAFLAGVTRLWSDPFTSQNGNVGLKTSGTDEVITKTFKASHCRLEITDVVRGIVEEARKPIANHQTPMGIGDDVGGKPWRNAKVGLRRDAPQVIGKHFAVVHVVNDIWKVLAHIPGGVDRAGEQPHIVQRPLGARRKVLRHDVIVGGAG